MSMFTEVTATRFRLEGRATCSVCDWSTECTRTRARVHVKSSGHTVRFVIEDVTVYRPADAS